MLERNPVVAALLDDGLARGYAGTLGQDKLPADAG
nr:hypothetical protein [Escherichia coli]